MLALLNRQKECLKEMMVNRKEVLQKICVEQSLFKEIKSPEVIGPGETSFEKLIAEVDHELINHHLIELESIEIALNRIEHGSYGVCIDCDSRIAYNRLKAYPMARRCFECKEYFEKQSA